MDANERLVREILNYIWDKEAEAFYDWLDEKEMQIVKQEDVI